MKCESDDRLVRCCRRVGDFVRRSLILPCDAGANLRQVNGSERRVPHRRPQAGVSMHLRRCPGSRQDRDTEARGTWQNSIRQTESGEHTAHRAHRSALKSLIQATFCEFSSRLHLVLQIIILHTVADELFNGKPQASVHRTLLRRLRLAVKRIDVSFTIKSIR